MEEEKVPPEQINPQQITPEQISPEQISPEQISQESPQKENPQDQPPQEGKTLFVFESLEYINWHHNWYWFLGFGTVWGLLVLYNLLTKNWLGLIAFILAGVAFFIFIGKVPKKLFVEIKEGGIRIENNFYPYSTLKGFWISTFPYEGKTLSMLCLEPKKRFLPILKIAILKTEPEEIESILSNYLNPTEPKDDIIDKLSHFLKL